MDAQTPADALNSDFRIGRMVQRAFGVMVKSPLKLLTIALLFDLPLQYSSIEIASHVIYPKTVLSYIIYTIILDWPSTFLDTTRNALLSLAIVHTLQGGRMHLRQSMTIGLRRMLPVISLATIFSIAISVGIIFLILPWFVFFSIYGVAVPVCVVEKRGVLDSLRRSVELTKGYRWQLIGFYILLQIAVIVGITVIHAVFATPLKSLYGWIAISTTWGTLFEAMGMAFVVAIYYELRVAKEVPAPDRIASVFD